MSGGSVDSRDDISTVNTNRLKQMFDTYNKHGIAAQTNKKIAVQDMERARTQFPSYMNRVYGRKQSNEQKFENRPYEIPNLSLFPAK